MAMNARKPRKPRPPLDAAKLDELAIFYVGRFATSRAKLATYLDRKLRERGWADGQPADIPALVDRLARLGYVDDQAFALLKARSLSARGYGSRRVCQALQGAGIAEEDSEAARDLSESETVEAALRLARRRRIGPFATGELTPKERERALSTMLRAGHGFSLSRAIVDAPPGCEIDQEILAAIR